MQTVSHHYSVENYFLNLGLTWTKKGNLQHLVDMYNKEHNNWHKLFLVTLTWHVRSIRSIKSTKVTSPGMWDKSWVGTVYAVCENLTLLPSVNTVIARGMFCGVKYTHHTFTPIIKHLITKTAKEKKEKNPGKKSFTTWKKRISDGHRNNMTQ